MINKNKVACLFVMVFALFSCDKNEPTTIEDRSDWMSELVLDYIGQNVALTDICIPGSHDAGTYLFRGCTIGANACNTRTQNINFTKQLKAGIRMFDVRPVLTGGLYFTQHVTGCDGLGCRGDLIQNLLDQIRAFLDEHNELVILQLGHFCNTGSTDEELINMVNGTLGDRLFTDNASESLDFINTALKNIIPPENSAGKVIVTYDGAANTLNNRSRGVFSNSYIKTSGTYANAQEYPVMKADQLNKFNNWSGSKTSLFNLSWTLTMDETLAVPCAVNPNATSIQDMANSANVNLEDDMLTWMNNGTISKGKIVNILGSDYVTHEVTDVCIDITEFNLN